MRAWVEEHITPNIAEWEDVGECPAWAYAQAAKDGLLVPAACGAKIDKRYRDRSDRRGVISGIKVGQPGILLDGMCRSLSVIIRKRIRVFFFIFFALAR